MKTRYQYTQLQKEVKFEYNDALSTRNKQFIALPFNITLTILQVKEENTLTPRNTILLERNHTQYRTKAKILVN